jgi:hypothetical protein
MELNIHIENIDDIVAGKCKVLLSVQSTQPWEVWPIGYQFGPEVHRVLIKASSKEEGQVVFVPVDDEMQEGNEMEPILPVFFLVNGEMQVRSDEEIEVTVKAIDAGGQEIEGFAKTRSKNFMSSMSEPRIEPFPSGRMLLRITVEEPSQLCLDLWDEDAEYPHSSICIAHEANEEKAWANVYRDILSKGVWVPDKRTKLGYFLFNKSEAYEAVILVRDGKVCITFSSINGPVAMRKGGDLENEKVDKIRIRESPSASGHPGIYDIEVI